jgi:transposase-like protein
MEQPEDLATIREAARRIGVDPLTLHEWIDEGQLRQYGRVSISEARALADRTHVAERPNSGNSADWRTLLEDSLASAGVALSQAISRANLGSDDLPFPHDDLVRLREAVQRRRELLKGQPPSA